MMRAFVTVGYVGRLRPAPGTWGSLAALPLAWLLHAAGGPGLLCLAIAVAFFAGWHATAAVTRGAPDPDPAEIVIDEVVGQWIALLPVSLGAARVGVEIMALWPGWIAAFVLFRLFDIWKPWLVGRADARGDALGVMLDDVVAGVLAAIATFALGALWHLAILA